MNRMRWVALGASLVLFMVVASAAAPPTGEVNYDLPPQSLQNALNAFAEQSNLRIVFPSDIAVGKTSPAVMGKLTPEGALKRLLTDTNLAYEFIDERTVSVHSVAVGITDAGSLAFNGEGIRVAQAESANAADLPQEKAEGVRKEEQGAQLEEIVVTGTHIRNAAPVSAPLRTLSREEIDASGAVSTAQLIESLPQHFGGGVAEGTSAIFVPNDGKTERNVSQGTGVNLRGLGSDATLVLLNGHRLAQTGAGDFVDISQIPISAIDHVDILTDGASAIYGSDAVAGVVNIVLRKHFDGVETRARYGSVTEGAFAQSGAGFTLGRSRDRGGVLISYDYFRQGELSREDRAFARAPVGDLVPEQKIQNVIVNGGERFGSVSLRYDALYTHRHTDFLLPESVNSPAADEIRNTPSDFYSGSLGLDIPIAPDWLMSFGALYSGSHIATASHALTGAFLGRQVYGDELSSLSASLAGQLLTLPAGRIRTTIGADFRREQSTFKRFIPGFSEERRDSRNVNAVYAEGLIPILGSDGDTRSALDLSLAVRHENYSDLGSTTNPKIGVSWTPVGGLHLRSTYGTSFRAASFTQADVTHNQTFFLDFPDPDFSSTSLTLFQVGNSTELAPEKSRSWNVGVDLTPAAVRGLRASLDYFNTKFRNRIQTPSATAFDVLALENVYAPIITRNPSAALIEAIVTNPGADGLTDFTGGLSDPADTAVVIDNRAQNIGITRVAGLDLALVQEHEWNAIEWRISLDATRLLTWENQITPPSTAVDIAGTLFSPPKWRARAGIGATRGPLQVSTFVTFVPSYTNNLVIPSANISSWTTLDVSLAYRIPDAETGFWKNSQLRLTARNLLDRSPPFVSSAGNATVLPIGFDAANANPIGRFLNIEISKRF